MADRRRNIRLNQDENDRRDANEDEEREEEAAQDEQEDPDEHEDDRLEREAEEALQQERASFTNALVLCGITDRYVLRYLSTAQQLNTMTDFVDLTLQEIGDMITIINKTPSAAPANRRVSSFYIINAVATKRLKSLREWAKWRIATNQPFGADRFNRTWMKWSIDRMDFEARLKSSDDTVGTKPEPLKSVGYKAWTPFWRQLTNYCSTIRGTLNIPIAYVLRDNIEPDRNLLSDQYDSSDEALMACVVLDGTYFKEDNAKVWDILESAINQGNAWPFIKKFQKKKDGRAAITVLRGQSEGSAASATRKKVAYNILDTQKYDGKGRFTFGNYVEKLQFAFSELEECGDPQSESHKIHILTNGCPSEAMFVGRETVTNDDEKYNTFQKACEFLTGYCDRHSNTSISQNRRSVSVTQSSHEDDNDDYSDLKDSYSSTEWSKLSAATRSRVIKRNRKKNRGYLGQSKSAGTSTSTSSSKRKIKQIQTENNDDSPSDEDDNDNKDDDSDTTPVTRVSSTRASRSKSKPAAKKS